MEKWHVVALLLLGVALLAVAVFARGRYGDKYELKTIDLILIILPLLFMLLISGNLQVLEGFGVKADFSKLFSDAADTNIVYKEAEPGSPGVDEVVHMLETSGKSGVQQIPKLLENKTEALRFRLGHGGYYGPAIRQYFDALYASSYLQYLIILDDKGKLFGIYDALDLTVYFRTKGEQAYRNFARWLNRPDNSSLQELTRLPGFVGAGQAVARKSSKREVLKRMEELHEDSLPVVDKDGFFVGTVERSQLTASLILDVTDRLAGSGAD